MIIQNSTSSVKSFKILLSQSPITSEWKVYLNFSTGFGINLYLQRINVLFDKDKKDLSLHIIVKLR